MKRACKLMGNLMVAMAMLIAPQVSGICHVWLYEEKEPEGFDDFAKRK